MLNQYGISTRQARLSNIGNELCSFQVKWMMYWIVFAFFNAITLFTDVFISWFPGYYLFKTLFIIWLVSPATRVSVIDRTHILLHCYNKKISCEGCCLCLHTQVPLIVHPKLIITFVALDQENIWHSSVLTLIIGIC